MESVHTHDYKSCRCGRVSTDGGKDYQIISYTEPTDYTGLSVYSDQPFELVRQFLCRVGYGKPGSSDYGTFRVTYFPNMSDEHLQASLEYPSVTKGGRHWLHLLQEKLYRAEKEIYITD